jgi:hypothetical protein
MIPSLVSTDRARLQGTPVSVLREFLLTGAAYVAAEEVHYADTQANAIDEGKPGR